MVFPEGAPTPTEDATFHRVVNIVALGSGATVFGAKVVNTALEKGVLAPLDGPGTIAKSLGAGVAVAAAVKVISHFSDRSTTIAFNKLEQSE